MPVEIRELVIRAVVDGKEKKREAAREHADPVADQRLIEECVRQVMKILKRKGER